MKIHSIVDCITNSSSTTFIISLDKMPESPEELHNILFYQFFYLIYNL